MPATKRKTAIADTASAINEEISVDQGVTSGGDNNVVRTLNVEACKSWLAQMHLLLYPITISVVHRFHNVNIYFNDWST